MLSENKMSFALININEDNIVVDIRMRNADF